jgi:hypothetical protein
MPGFIDKPFQWLGRERDHGAMRAQHNAEAYPARSFGADDRPKCEKCGTQTSLTRRTPHPTRGARYELQSFTCRKCGHVQYRDADAGGAA